MSLSEKMIDILDVLVTQFQNINGGSDYHYEINHNNIYKKYLDYSQVQGYPSICISSMGTQNSRQTDQVTYDCPLMIEIFGYIFDQDSDNLLERTAELAQDMEKVLYSNENLSDNVYEFSLDIEIATFESYGIVRLIIKAVMNYFKS